MNDYYLKTTNEQELWEILTRLNLARLNEDSAQYESLGINLDIIGVIYKPTGNTIQIDSMLIPEQLPAEGFHANIRGILTDEQVSALPLVLAPLTPHRVWL